MKQSNLGDRDIQLIIGNLLRYGVWTALTVATLGGIIYLFRHDREFVNYQTFVEHDDNIFDVIKHMLNGVFQGYGHSIILLGVMLLFLTPILRLIFSLVAFFIEKDYLYVGITLLVIGIICFSVFFGFAH
ncbi:DUF1634 domain-containing protein [Olivibacter ginsenosidimutans]|uniref:DUF1634 domain-containing protein n=1 Tax=Olivibacter ginsenosidimutans TaxID=1176537 RepID=A0ABP9BDK2_9SPHI